MVPDVDTSSVTSATISNTKLLKCGHHEKTTTRQNIKSKDTKKNKRLNEKEKSKKRRKNRSELIW